MHRGYIKLWRKSLESPTWDNHNVWRLWCWCLMKATHKPHKCMIGFKEIDLEPGQFIFGRKKCSIETGISERTVRTCLQALKSTSNLTIKTTNKFSVISIINWEIYQVDEFENDQQNDQQKANNRPTTDQQLTTYKNIKNVKKKDRESAAIVPEWIPKETWQAFKEFRIRKKAPLTDLAVKKTINELERLKKLGHDPKAVIEQSVYRGWTGVFPIKDDFQKQDSVKAYTPPNRTEEIMRKAIEREKYLRGESDTN